MTFTAYDPRRLAETLDLLDTTVSMLIANHDAVVLFARGQPKEAFEPAVSYLADAITDSKFIMREIQEAIDQSPEANKAATAEQPRPSWE